MVAKEEIVNIARRQKLPVGTIEKDFVLTFVLKKLYESELKDSLVFKGGTALHKLYLHKRMSIDLDFTELKPVNIEELKKIIEDKEIRSKIKEVNKTSNSTKVVLNYESVLEYKNSIILDISKREKPTMELITKQLKSPYFEKIPVLTLALEELAAEKIRSIIQRNKPRDYFDLYYILGSKKLNFKKALKIAKKKLAATNDKYDTKKIFDNLDIVKDLWEKDLTELVVNTPDFEKVVKKLKKYFKQK